MAIMETKIIQVQNDPETINAANESWARWGWNVLNLQVTHTQDTKTYTEWYQRGTGEATVETTTINYATITYQRDKSMPCYDRIVELEQEYNNVQNRVWSSGAGREEVPKVAEFDVSIIAIGVALIWSIACIQMKTLAAIWPAIVYFGYKILQYLNWKKPENQEAIRRKNEIQERNAQKEQTFRRQIEAEKAKILQEAATLLKSA